jgi:Cu-Zn family superoxide dismutase
MAINPISLESQERKMRKVFPLMLLPLMSACAMTTTDRTTISGVVTADLARADGSWAGVATISKRSDGTFLSLSGVAPAPGTYGMHVHEVGKCQGPDFTTAGSHWNPAMKQHGLENPMGAHRGDLPNVIAGADRKFSLEQKLDEFTLEGADGLLDSDGAALIIHEKADDYRTDPTGNSGKRIICGVFRSGNRS